MIVRCKKKVVLCSVILILVFGACDAEDDGTNIMRIASGDNRQPKSVLRYNLQKREDEKSANATDDEAESFVPYDLEIVVDALKRLNDTACRRDALTVLEAIARRERWALQMFDSSAKFPVGILHGAFYQFGNFDECIGIASASHAIQGQYCLADIELFKKSSYEGRVARSSEIMKKRSRNLFNSTIHWGICVPSSCTTEEVQIVVKQIFVLATDHEGISVRLDEDKCYFDRGEPLNALQIIYAVLLGLFLTFIAATTIYHYYSIQQKKKFVVYNVESARSNNDNLVREALLCFSLLKNVKKFLQTKPSTLNLECICGIRVLSMLFIVAGHTLIFLIGGPVINTDFYDEESTSLANSIFLNSPLLVDTFLLISGFLMCYLLLIELDKRKGRINVLILYIARYIRLTPSYLVVIGFYCTFLITTGNGPLWHSRIRQEQERCLKSWWTNLLYINNYVNTNNMCMFQSWYLAVDYHLFIVAPFIIYPLWKWKKIGKSLLGVFTIISIAVPFVVTLVEKYDATFLVFAPEVYDLALNFYFKSVYTKTHMRASSYFLGLLFGHQVYKLQTKGTKISKYVIWLGWIVCALCGVLSMSSVIVFYFPSHEYNAVESAVYAALHRVAWCLSIGWILVACITDNANLVNRFLSWKPFVPLSRLTYCAYLINGFVEIYGFGSTREGTFMSKFELTNKILAHGVLTFSLAFVLCVLFESPIHGLEKILLRRAKIKESSRDSQSNDLESS